MNEYILLLLGFAIVLLFAIAIIWRFVKYRHEQERRRWSFTNERDAIDEQDWLNSYATSLSASKKASVAKLLDSVTESTSVSWTKFRPDDLVGPHLFDQNSFEIEDSWGLFSDFVRVTEPDLYKKIELVWLQDENGFRIQDLISSFGADQNASGSGKIKGVRLH